MAGDIRITAWREGFAEGFVESYTETVRGFVLNLASEVKSGTMDWYCAALMITARFRFSDAETSEFLQNVSEALELSHSESKECVELPLIGESPHDEPQV